jgi:U3 small nucleolar RNA-associated protein 20
MPQQKFYIRSVSAIIDNFHFNLEAKEVVEVDADEKVEEEGEEANQLSGTPGQRITEVVLDRLLPALSKFVAQKDETEDIIRIPVALGIVKIASALPTESSEVEVVRIITTVSQILRSKEQDTRDLAKETLCKIAVFLGPDWLVRILKELRNALQRGPQKHVLAVTAHAILVQATEQGNRFDLDHASEDAVQVSAEVIWGESGKDVESEGFKTKMREVRGAASRGFDTFQLVSRLVSPGRIRTILAPLREVMHASQAVRTMQHVDEALRRIALGLNANDQLQPEDILGLCFSLVSGNSSYLRSKGKARAVSEDRFTVQMKRNAQEENDFYSLNAHKFVAFGLDLFVTAFRRGKFDFDNVDILSRLGPLVNAIGNTLYSTHSNVLILGLKASAAIVRCPISQVEQALPVFINNVFKVLKLAGGSAESELAQTALKTLAVMVRDCKMSVLSDNQLKYLLEIVSPDLEEADRQAAIFAALRAVVSRNFVVPEIYDLMERVSSIMITSQSTQVQEQCRALLIQFLLDYPQGSGRLKQQMTFLARNLDYVFESGRVSVMELLSAILSKFSDELVQEYADLFFVGLVAVLANDDAEKCRIMAGALIRQLFGRLGEAQQKKKLAVVKSWVDAREANADLAGAAMAVYGLLVEGGIEVDCLREILRPIIEESAKALAEAEGGEDVVLTHALPLQAISTAAKAIKADTSIVADFPWNAIISHLLFPHDWVRFAAARALASLFALKIGNGSASVAFQVLDDEALLDIAKKSCLLLKGSKTAEGDKVVVDRKLADQLVKLLWNISKHWAVRDSPFTVRSTLMQSGR